MNSVRPGLRFRSAVCETEVVIVRAGRDDVALECGGIAMVLGPGALLGEGPVPGLDAGSVLGKRYVDAGGVIEVLCVHAGKGSLAVAGDLLQLVSAKQLPSSD